jgi:hypothetical protein
MIWAHLTHFWDVTKTKDVCTRTKNFPPLKRETNAKLLSQASKLGLVKGFGEDICKLVMGVNMNNKVNVPFLIVVSQEVKTDLYVLGFGVENGIFGYTYDTCAVTGQRHSPKL